MRKLKAFLLSASLSLMAVNASAENLLEVYNQALNNDTTFKAAQARWRAAQEDVTINRALLLPNLNASYSWTSSRIDSSTPGTMLDVDGRFRNTENAYSLNLTQPIFNMSSWAALSSARATTKQAGAVFLAAQQDLMLRTATAYFAVLGAQDNLRFTRAEKKAIGQQLEQAQERFKVGLIPITGVYEAQASYDAIIAREFANENELANRFEELREITGKVYFELAGINVEVPLLLPQPSNINNWVHQALKQNYTLKSRSYAVEAARANVNQARSGFLPVINAVASIGLNDQSNPVGTGSSRQEVLAGGASVEFPLFSGFSTVAQTNKASSLYSEASALHEQTYRDVVSQTRQAFLGVISGMSKVKADRQALKSRVSALEAIEASYRVGTRTIVDVLDSQSDLYNEQQNYANDQYSYILNILTLKQAAGTLGVEDIAAINSWLQRKIAFPDFDMVINQRIKELGGDPRQQLPAPKYPAFLNK